MNMRLGGPGPFGRLSTVQVGELRIALLDAFPKLAGFDDMLLVFAGQVRDQIALGEDLKTIVRLVIQAAEADSWTARLLAAAREASPHNVALLGFSQQFGLAPAAEALQRKIRASGSLLDLVPFQKGLGEVEGRVCRVEIATGNPPDYGTGFLLGPDVLMTNFHVMQSVIEGSVPPDKVVLRFDYKRLADGAEVNPGTEYKLAPAPGEWLLHASRYSPNDLLALPLQDAQPDELDFVLLRLEGSPGNDPIGGPDKQPLQPQPRGWVEMPAMFPTLTKESTVIIVQHPLGEPLKLAFETQAVLGVSPKATRVRYATTTEAGSSGSPCFDTGWNLIALHHAGDPRYAKFQRPEFNQGIPMAAIAAELNRTGKIGLIRGA